MAKKSWWERQYQQGPYGASRSVPAARRNASKKKKSKSRKKPKMSAARRAELSAVGTRAQQIAKQHGCDMSAAMTAAWAEVRGHRAAANPWDNPVRSSLVRAPYEWSDETEVFSALIPRSNPRRGGHNPFSDFSSRPRMQNYEQVVGQFSTQENWLTRGVQPMNRRNPGGLKQNRFGKPCALCGGHASMIGVKRGMKGPRGGKVWACPDCL